jgi:hypothetical protein
MAKNWSRINDQALGNKKENLEWKGSNGERPSKKGLKERKDRMFREKKLMTRCIKMKERINC